MVIFKIGFMTVVLLSVYIYPIAFSKVYIYPTLRGVNVNKHSTYRVRFDGISKNKLKHISVG